MPINFEKKDLTFPFKIYAYIENEKLYVSVEELSILYDYFNDKVIDIKNIGKYQESSDNESINVYMSINLTQNGTVITSAEIILSNDGFEQTYDSNGYLVLARKLIGSVLVLENKQISINQNVLTNLTKYACGGVISNIL